MGVRRRAQWGNGKLNKFRHGMLLIAIAGLYTERRQLGVPKSAPFGRLGDVVGKRWSYGRTRLAKASAGASATSSRISNMPLTGESRGVSFLCPGKSWKVCEGIEQMSRLLLSGG